MAAATKRQRLALVQAQQRLLERGRALAVVVAGLDGSGRHAVINALTHALDTRGVRVHAWTREEAPGADHTGLWPYWQHAPEPATVTLYLDGWYAEPIDAALAGRNAEAAALAPLDALEAQWRAHGHGLLKLWVPRPLAEARRLLRSRLKRERREPLLSEARVLAADDAAEPLITALSHPDRGWRHLPSEPSPAARQAVAWLLEALAEPEPEAAAPAAAQRSRRFPPLERLDPGARLEASEGRRQLKRLQAALGRAVWAAHARRQPVLVVLEGADAAGKGGVIRRLTDPLDARLFDVVPIAAPSAEEAAHPWLWRFWRRLPRRGQLVVFDRSWYGRVLVERVEGFCSAADWQRAFAEIVDFEHQFVRAGGVLCKFWLEVSADEQLRRFQARAARPHKRHKLTEEDWRNREKAPAYRVAVGDALARTHRPEAPWTVVAADCKHHARLQVLGTLLAALEG